MKSADHEVQLDFSRRMRIGIDEAIFSEGKSVPQLNTILAQAIDHGASLLLTRLPKDKLDRIEPSLRAQIDYCEVSRTGIFGVPHPLSRCGAVAIVAAGSSDAGVVREVERTLGFNGVETRSFIDVGVAGLWRLTSKIDEIAKYSVVVAVAGMDAALPTVLGGLVRNFIIAVPTSTGYGVAAGGHSALNSILASCAPGIVTVNIDNGYGAACAALRALDMVCQFSEVRAASPALESE